MKKYIAPSLKNGMNPISGYCLRDIENCCYILTSGADKLPYVMIRGLAVGVMHIVCTIFVSVGLMILRRFKTVSIAGMIGALAHSFISDAVYPL